MGRPGLRKPLENGPSRVTSATVRPGPHGGTSLQHPTWRHGNPDAPQPAPVRAAGAAPIRRGDPGYRAALDRDGDGEGCAGD
ncbi:excalibur calcium-binding domain-containing protein [Pseudonocardia xinjiangensis]|uniref:excalibur calcium-binding domain-containing protein n=1 Tax=Pseudonocardia xinjiangensis TaxID=75289 RepID=UPI0028AC0109|nr:excalibur calcium-binding domain-containing protein [Pseudonocardia xinjiangensis]